MKKFDEFLNERKITQKQAINFEKQVKKTVEEHGGNLIDGHGQATWNLETKFGNLKITLHDDAGSEIYSIFMKFDEPERAKDTVDCNPYSGKWNIHQSNSEWCLWELEGKLGMITSNFDILKDTDKADISK